MPFRKKEEWTLFSILMIFSGLFLLEIIIFSVFALLSNEDICKYECFQFATCLAFGNMFLIYGMLSKNSSILTSYFLVYVYTIIAVFIITKTRRVMTIVLNISQLIIAIIRGIIVYILYIKFLHKFISFYFRKYQHNEKLIGK